MAFYTYIKYTCLFTAVNIVKVRPKQRYNGGLGLSYQKRNVGDLTKSKLCGYRLHRILERGNHTMSWSSLSSRTISKVGWKSKHLCNHQPGWNFLGHGGMVSPQNWHSSISGKSQKSKSQRPLNGRLQGVKVSSLQKNTNIFPTRLQMRVVKTIQGIGAENVVE